MWAESTYRYSFATTAVATTCRIGIVVALAQRIIGSTAARLPRFQVEKRRRASRTSPERQPMKMKRLTTIGSSLAVLFAIGLLVSSARAVLAAPPKCVTQGFLDIDPATEGNQPGINCPPSSCSPDPGTCGKLTVPSPVYGPYQTCTCQNEGEPTCCHLIFRTGADIPINDRFVGSGNCLQQEVGCPPGNKCSKRGGGSIGDPIVHECETAPQ